MIRTCEFVSPKHPDKICDYIADSILDAFLALDPKSRVAVEVMGGHGEIAVNGEVTSQAKVDVASVVQNIVGPKFSVRVNVAPQSPFIAIGVDSGGAGDQGVMLGYAVAETPSFMPLEYELARNLCQRIYEVYPYDGKVQVTLNGEQASCVVASFQNAPHQQLEELVCSIISAKEYLINPAGDWSLGGFDADTGLSGRKIVMDNYGSRFAVGGGSFSGKDSTKVDRSAAYMARKIAKDLLVKHSAQEVAVKLAYAIGKAYPVMAVAEVDGKQIDVEGYNLTPAGITKALSLDKMHYAETSQWGHFGQSEFPWE